jgi:hypothetical protein
MRLRGLVGALVALLACGAGFFTAELVGTATGVRGTAAQAGDLAFLFRRHGSETTEAALLGGNGVLDGFLHGFSV